MKFFRRVICFVKENQWGFFFQRSRVRVRNTSVFKIGGRTQLLNCTIFIDKDSSLIIGDDVVIEKCSIYVKGYVSIGNFTQLKYGHYIVDDGKLIIGHHTKLTPQRFWIRFGGVTKIGNYTNINDGSELRCDEAIKIGNYNQISYNVNIWDTNTHNIYPLMRRRELAEKYWPYFGKEVERPKTKPIYIGDDCWIGESSSILKGTTLNNGVIVGYRTIIVGATIDTGKKVVNEISLNIM